MGTLNTQMSASEKIQVDQAVDFYNKQNTVNGRKTSNELGKDEFLKLLITQMSNQDPTEPTDNTEFIAQMAQFSSLEQMYNMNTSFQKMASYLTETTATATLGKTVELNVGDATVTGVVQGTIRGENPEIIVNGMRYDINKIAAIYAN